MFANEQTIMKKGMECLNNNLNTIEVEIFISTILKSAYDYTKWRQEYFETAYISENRTQLQNFLDVAANNDPIGKSVGL